MMNKSEKITLLLIGGVVTAAIAASLLAILAMDTKGTGGSGLSKDFTYDLEHLKKTDPKLIIYEEVAGSPFPTGLAQPLALAIGPEDTIFVAAERSVHTFTTDGKPGELAFPLEGNPRCLTVAKDGTVYVGVQKHIEVYSPSGRLAERWESAGAKVLFTSIAVAEDIVYVADFGKKEVLRFDLSGNPMEPIGEFVIPSPYFDVALDQNGLLHVANTGEHRIETYSKEGNLSTYWGEFSNIDIKHFSGCCNPVNIALLPEGRGFVTAEKGLTRVKVYDSDGAFQGFVAGPESFTRHDSLCNAADYDPSRVGLDVDVDNKGRVVVLDPATAELRIFVSATVEAIDK